MPGTEVVVNGGFTKNPEYGNPAVAAYGDAAREGIERTMRELQDLRRQASSGLIVPPAGAAAALTGGGLGGMPGGGKIQLP